MGAYKYVEELYKKKQSDVLRFLLRVRLVSDPPRPTASTSTIYLRRSRRRHLPATLLLPRWFKELVLHSGKADRRTACGSMWQWRRSCPWGSAVANDALALIGTFLLLRAQAQLHAARLSSCPARHMLASGLGALAYSRRARMRRWMERCWGERNRHDILIISY